MRRLLRSLLERRLAHEPTAYIVGRREFYGLDLETTPAALIPRPETELLVREAIARRREPLLIVDVGTGNGAIAVALAVHLPQAALVAIDLSRGALALAVRNARRHGVESRVSFLQADLLAPLAQPADIIVANLPYVCTADWEALPPEIREHEPRCALDGGPDGLREIGRAARAGACLSPARRRTPDRAGSASGGARPGAGPPLLPRRRRPRSAGRRRPGPHARNRRALRLDEPSACAARRLRPPAISTSPTAGSRSSCRRYL